CLRRRADRVWSRRRCRWAYGGGSHRVAPPIPRLAAGRSGVAIEAVGRSPARLRTRDAREIRLLAARSRSRRRQRFGQTLQPTRSRTGVVAPVLGRRRSRNEANPGDLEFWPDEDTLAVRGATIRRKRVLGHRASGDRITAHSGGVRVMRTIFSRL